MKTASTPFAIGDPFAKDQPRTPAGESAMDEAARIAQQGAGIQRVKAANFPKKAERSPRPPMTSAFHDPEIRILFPFRDFKVGDWVQLIDRFSLIEGEILHVYSDSDLLLIERFGQYQIVNRRYVYKNDLAPLVDQPQPCKALVVYEPPQRPAVNVLPTGETPIPLFAPDQKWQNYNENATQKREKYQKLEHEAMGWVSQHSDKFYCSGVESQYSKSCHILAMASNEIGYRYQFRGHAGYKNAYAYR